MATNAMTNPLTQLKDIQLPNPVSIWPLAYGWYIIIALTLIFVGVLLWLIVKYIKKTRYKKKILALFDHLLIHANDTKLSHNEFVLQLSRLLKEVAMTKFPHESPHGLYGEQWIDFLNKHSKTNNFSAIEALPLKNLYQEIKTLDREKLIAVAKKWARGVL